MSRKLSLWTLLAVTVSAGAIFLGCAAHDRVRPLSASTAGAEDGDEGDEVRIPLDQVPAAVMATFRAEANGGEITEVEMETEHGRTTYEEEVNIGGKVWSIEVAQDGTLLEKEVEDGKDED